MRILNEYFLRGRALLRGKREPKVFIVSFPKSGRTWLRVLIGKAIFDHCGLSRKELILDTYKLTNLAGVHPTRLTHDDTATMQGTTGDRLETCKERYRGKRVLFVIREPRDVVVSCFFQASKRERIYDGTISEFLHDPKFGIEKVARFDKIWYENRDVPKEFMLLRYEDLHANPEQSLAKCLGFLGVEAVSDRVIQDAVAFAKFENMRKLEAGNYFERGMLRPANSQDEESFKVRRGKVKGYLTHFSPEDPEYARQVLEQFRCPFTEPYLQVADAQAA